MTQQTPTTNKEAKAYFENILKGNTFKDWREFLGTMSGLNTKKMTALELYDLKVKLDNALRTRNKPKGGSVDKRVEKTIMLTSALECLEEVLDRVTVKLNSYALTIEPTINASDALFDWSKAGSASLKQETPKRVGWFKRLLRRNG